MASNIFCIPYKNMDYLTFTIMHLQFKLLWDNFHYESQWPLDSNIPHGK